MCLCIRRNMDCDHLISPVDCILIRHVRDIDVFIRNHTFSESMQLFSVNCVTLCREMNTMMSMADKKKVLMLCDHPLSTSGVGTQARWLIAGLVNTGKYSFKVFGGAVRHDNYDTVTVN